LDKRRWSSFPLCTTAHCLHPALLIDRRPVQLDNTLPTPPASPRQQPPQAIAISTYIATSAVSSIDSWLARTLLPTPPPPAASDSSSNFSAPPTRPATSYRLGRAVLALHAAPAIACSASSAPPPRSTRPATPRESNSRLSSVSELFTKTPNLLGQSPLQQRQPSPARFLAGASTSSLDTA